MLVSLLLMVLWSGQAPESVTAALSRQQFRGHWQYNPDQSVDAATGRAESARPTSQRRGVDGAPGTGPGRRVGDGGGGGGNGGGGGVGPTGTSVAQDPLYSLYLARRDTRRDLLEIAPKLAIDILPDAVKVTDDLDRVLTFQTNGTKQNYQLGAAQFSARSSWDGNRLTVDIEGPDGLRMTETWFLSDDGGRLFLVIRMGDLDRDGRPVGVNRVYDRVQ